MSKTTGLVLKQERRDKVHVPVVCRGGRGRQSVSVVSPVDTVDPGPRGRPEGGPDDELVSLVRVVSAHVLAYRSRRLVLNTLSHSSLLRGTVSLLPRPTEGPGKNEKERKV